MILQSKDGAEGLLPLILVSANFVGRVFGGVCRHFTDPKIGKISGICERRILV